MKRVLISISMTLLITAIWLLPNTSQAASCDLTKDATSLAALHTQTEYSGNELTLRKTVLLHVIDCAKIDTQSLADSLSHLSPASQDFINLSSQFTLKLNQALTYYENARARIPDLGIRGTQDLAYELLLWRGREYASAAGATRDFIMWNNNQELFRRADDRFAHIQNTVRSFKIIDNNDVATVFKDAEQVLAEAHALNDQAKDALLHYPLINDTSTPIKASLEKLAAVYQKFFDVGHTIETILPHS